MTERRPLLRAAFAVAPWIVAGLLLGAGVHIASVLALPQIAPDDARSRLAGAVPINGMTLLGGSSGPSLPASDPAFESAICRFDLTAGILHVQAPVSQHYTAVSLYTATGLVIGAVNDRAATRRTLDIFVMTAAQRRAIDLGEDDTRADNLIIVSPTAEGFALVRALAVQPSHAPMLRELLSTQAKCETIAQN